MPNATGPSELQEGWWNILADAGKEAIKENPVLVFVFTASGVLVVTQLPKVLKHLEEIAKIKGENKIAFERERTAHKQQQVLADQTKLVQHVMTQKFLFERNQPVLFDQEIDGDYND